MQSVCVALLRLFRTHGYLLPGFTYDTGGSHESARIFLHIYECPELQEPPFASCVLLFCRSAHRDLCIPIHRSILSSLDAHDAFVACVGRWPSFLLLVAFPLRRFCGFYLLSLAAIPYLLYRFSSVLLVWFQCDVGFRLCRLAYPAVSTVPGQLSASGIVLVFSPAYLRTQYTIEARHQFVLSDGLFDRSFLLLCDSAVSGITDKHLREGNFDPCWT